MLVKELIRLLKEMPQDLPVLVDIDWTHCGIGDVSIFNSKKNGKYVLID